MYLCPALTGRAAYCTARTGSSGAAVLLRMKVQDDTSVKHERTDATAGTRACRHMPMSSASSAPAEAECNMHASAASMPIRDIVIMGSISKTSNVAHLLRALLRTAQRGQSKALAWHAFLSEHMVNRKAASSHTNSTQVHRILCQSILHRKAALDTGHHAMFTVIAGATAGQGPVF